VRIDRRSRRRATAWPCAWTVRWTRPGRSPRHDHRAEPAATGHPPGGRLYRLVRALCQTASDLDAAYARAQQAGRELHDLRDRPAAGTEGADDVGQKIASTVAELVLELVLERCEAMDTALIRLLGDHQELGAAPCQDLSRSSGKSVGKLIVEPCSDRLSAPPGRGRIWSPGPF